jgi:hypothetical protein
MEQLETANPSNPPSPAEVQVLHRRLIAARHSGIDPDPADVKMADKIKANPLAQFDRVWEPDER